MLVALGKTERAPHERCIEHSWSYESSVVRTHINKCEVTKHIKNLMLINTSLDGPVTKLRNPSDVQSIL